MHIVPERARDASEAVLETWGTPAATTSAAVLERAYLRLKARRALPVSASIFFCNCMIP